MKAKPTQKDYRLLSEFRHLFERKKFKHRISNQGDQVALHLYEDLLSIGRSPRFTDSVLNRLDRVVNIQNRRRGVLARRGDATFGQLIPGETPVLAPGYRVARGPVATIEIGVEVKILLKAMIKQIDRVISDLGSQVLHFRRGGDRPICVGIVGVNHAESVTGYEGERPFPTTGKSGFLHPYQEAPEAEKRLMLNAAPQFDVFLILKFKATNAGAYPFEWVNYDETRLDYAAALTRISALYQRTF